jgi:hypothetical protein
MLTRLRKTAGVAALLSFSLTVVRAFDVERALQETAAHINKGTPRPIGNDAQLDGAVAYQKTLKYRFSFKRLEKEDVSSAFVLKQTEFLTDFVCTTPEMKVFVENGVTLKYAYHDRRGRLVVVITVDPRTCTAE